MRPCLINHTSKHLFLEFILIFIVKDYYLALDLIVGILSPVDLKCKPIQRLRLSAH